MAVSGIANTTFSSISGVTMRVLLISANREEIYMRTLPLGLACVAAATKKQGHEVTLLDLMEEENPLESVRRTISRF